MGCMKKLCLLALTTLALGACAPASKSTIDDSGFRAENEPGFGQMSKTEAWAVPAYASDEEKKAVLAKYAHVDPQHLVNTAALQNAVLFYDFHMKELANPRYITVIDFSKHSGSKRMAVVEVSSGAVWQLNTAHGKGSDSNNDGYAEKFSNVEGSLASSLGYYTTAETYSGQHGTSLRLDGRSPTNSAARERAVVVHGADYVDAGLDQMGRSWGCPAVSMSNYRTLIDKIKGGSLLYAWVPGGRAP